MSTPTADTELRYTLYSFDACAITHGFRHSVIFGALNALNPGEAMRFTNDHDPIPLLNQMRERYGDRVKIIYQQREMGAIMIDYVVVA